MEKRTTLVIGASSGGFDVIQQLIARLPADLDEAICIVWHMASMVQGIMSQVLRKLTTIPVARAVDYEPIPMNRPYIAPPDHHLLLKEEHVHVTRGPKENYVRPASAALFRSAAYAYVNRVIGIIISDAPDDGAAGLRGIKVYGGMALVQPPGKPWYPLCPQVPFAR